MREVQDVIRKALGELYPKTGKLKDGRRVQIRPLQHDDEERLLRFFQEIPREERGRTFRDNVVDPILISKWCRKAHVSKVVALIALDGDRIVADGSIHLKRELMKRHVGAVRLTVHPEWRGAGLGKALLDELLSLAPNLGLSWIDAEAGQNQEPALRLLRALSFQKAGVFPGHLRDPLEGEQDLLVLTRSVSAPFPSDTGGGD